MSDETYEPTCSLEELQMSALCAQLERAPVTEEQHAESDERRSYEAQESYAGGDWIPPPESEEEE